MLRRKLLMTQARTGCGPEKGPEEADHLEKALEELGIGEGHITEGEIQNPRTGFWARFDWGFGDMTQAWRRFQRFVGRGTLALALVTATCLPFRQRDGSVPRDPGRQAAAKAIT
jgi:hypothetical protein